MLKLELNDYNLSVDFSCEDNDGDHVAVLDLLNSLIRELRNHENVRLVITSTEQEQEQEQDEFPVRDE